MTFRTDTNKFLSAEATSEATLATDSVPEVGEARCNDEACGHAARAWSNAQKYVDERYATRARAQAAAQRSTNDKNRGEAMDKMEKEDGRLCSEDPATQDESAHALFAIHRLSEEATLRETRQIGFWA